MTGVRGAASVVGAVLIGLLAFAPAAQAASDRLALGDSVMLGAANELRDLGFRVDATESRQAYSGPALLRGRGDALPTNVVVHLGTNGTFPLSTCKAIVRVAGPDRRVFFVNISVPRSWEKGNNAVLRQCDKAFADDRVQIVDWKGAVGENRQWLYSDRVHLKPEGQRAFARLIDGSVDAAIAEARRQALLAASGTGTAGLA